MKTLLFHPLLDDGVSGRRVHNRLGPNADHQKSTRRNKGWSQHRGRQHRHHTTACAWQKPCVRGDFNNFAISPSTMMRSVAEIDIGFSGRIEFVFVVPLPLPD